MKVNLIIACLFMATVVSAQKGNSNKNFHNPDFPNFIVTWSSNKNLFKFIL